MEAATNWFGLRGKSGVSDGDLRLATDGLKVHLKMRTPNLCFKNFHQKKQIEDQVELIP